jgi:hypothetical protein
MLRELTRVAAAICVDRSDLQNRRERRRAATSSPTGFRRGHRVSPSISADGRWLAFVSRVRPGRAFGQLAVDLLRDLVTVYPLVVPIRAALPAAEARGTGDLGGWTRVAFTWCVESRRGDTNGVRHVRATSSARRRSA